ncbi:MAG: hypothetical protein U0556_17750 [Dehalococcoidia bacterium]
MRRLVGSIGLVVAIILFVYVGAGPWAPPAILFGTPSSADQGEVRPSTSQPNAEQQARIESAMQTVWLISGGMIVAFVAIVIGTSLYLRRQREDA